MNAQQEAQNEGWQWIGSYPERITHRDLERVAELSKAGKGWPTVKMKNGKEYYFDGSGIIHHRRPYKPRIWQEREESTQRAVAFLSFVLDHKDHKRKSIVKTFEVTTYSIKHVFQSEYGYCSNGQTIEAARRLGIPLVMDRPETLNPLLPVSWPWLDRYTANRNKLFSQVRELQSDIEELIELGALDPVEVNATSSKVYESIEEQHFRLSKTLEQLREIEAGSESIVSEVER